MSHPPNVTRPRAPAAIMRWLHGGAGNLWLNSTWEHLGTPLALHLAEGCTSTAHSPPVPQALGKVLSPPQAPNLLLPLVSHPSKVFSPASAPKLCSWQKTGGQSAFSTHPNAPVRMDWSTRNVVERISMMRMSAGTLSPTARKRAGQLSQMPGRGTARPWRCCRSTNPASSSPGPFEAKTNSRLRVPRRGGRG